MWLQSVTLWGMTVPCSAFIKVTSSGCRLWTGWRKVRRRGICSWNCPNVIFWVNIHRCVSVCVSTRLQLRMCGQKEGCVFRGAEKRHFRLWWEFIYPHFYLSSHLTKTKVLLASRSGHGSKKDDKSSCGDFSAWAVYRSTVKTWSYLKLGRNGDGWRWQCPQHSLKTILQTILKMEAAVTI